MTTKSKSILKYIFAFLLVAFVVHHAGTEKIIGYLKQISLINCLLALIIITLAQILAGFRMRFFFQESGFPMTARYGIVLYYVGAFYNFLLPGGIGGDAYKVIIARRHMEMPAMQGIKIMIADRASGLCIVMLMLFAMLSQIDFSHTIPYAKPLLAAAGIFTLIAYVVFSKILVKQTARTMLLSLPYSLLSQLCWVVTLYIIWDAIGGGQHLVEYIAFYFAASIVGLIPVSVGGLGIKEMTYFYGADLMQHFAGITINADVGVSISICLFAMTFFASLPGLLMLEKVEKIKHYH